MARTGLYLSEVKKARDALIAQGRHPSVDAVRVELGNTGSKTTIHKYLKELEAEDGGAERKKSVSGALQDLVARMAAQLHEEANLRIEAAEQRSLAVSQASAETVAVVRQELEAVTGQRNSIEDAAKLELAAHGETRAALHAEAIARHTAEEHAAGLQLRLLENEKHRQSLEEKHGHAREALEHYRSSVKEQRDQDQRRHEQQVQQLQAEMRQLQQTLGVKQDEITRLNKEGARLVADIAHARKALFDQETSAREHTLQLDTLRKSAADSKAVASRLPALEAQVSWLQSQLGIASKEAQDSLARAHGLEIALATAHATLTSQQEMIGVLRAYAARHETAAGTSDGQ